jgi:hypothetical protein
VNVYENHSRHRSGYTRMIYGVGILNCASFVFARACKYLQCDVRVRERPCLLPHPPLWGGGGDFCTVVP